MGSAPIFVFVIIVAVGLLLLRKTVVSKKARGTSDHKPVARSGSKTPAAERIYTSWGYSFPAEYEFYPEDARGADQLLTDFKKLILANFKDCKVYCQVPASALEPSAHPASVPVPFIFEKEGQYRLAVFIVNSSNYRGMNVVATKDICSNMGMQWIQFFEEYANDDDYVVARIRHYLK